jgi:hypothetical protein
MSSVFAGLSVHAASNNIPPNSGIDTRDFAPDMKFRRFFENGSVTDFPLLFGQTLHQRLLFGPFISSFSITDSKVSNYSE